MRLPAVRPLPARPPPARRACWPVIIDAAFLLREKRASFSAQADEMGVGFCVLLTEAPAAELRRRLIARSGDASEATLAVLERQLTWFEPPDDEERNYAIAP